MNTGGEPIRNWVFWSGKMAAALRIASSLQRGRLGSPEDWREVKVDLPEWALTCDVNDQDFLWIKAEFYGQLQHWLALGDVQLQLDAWNNKLHFETNTLFSGLVL